MWRVLGVMISAVALWAATGIAADTKPDFSRVTSQQIAQGMAARGELVRVPLFPTELGGPDTPENQIYLPPPVVSSRQMIVGTLIRFTDEGLIDKLTIKPEYKGDSLVPVRIVYHATGKNSGGFDGTLEVW